MRHESWSVAAASVLGKSHEQTAIPCQDACAVKTSDDGKWVALVASDGAGTAAHSDVSSRLVASGFATALIELSTLLDQQSPGAWVTDAVISDIVGLRNQLRGIAQSDDISAYHCTLVAALVGPSGGFTIHVGDGAVFGAATDPSATDILDLSRDYFVSLPENGEYANETVFLTERDWIKHLRIQHVSAPDWLILGTDGGMALAMVGEQVPKSGFVAPVLHSLLSNPNRRSRDDALRVILSDRQADRLTNDDKSLVAIVRSHFREVEGEFLENKPPSIRPAVKPSKSIVAPKSAPELPDTKDLKSKPAPNAASSRSLFQKKSIDLFIIVGLLILLVSIVGLTYWLWPKSQGMGSRNDVSPLKVETIPTKNRTEQPVSQLNQEASSVSSVTLNEMPHPTSSTDKDLILPPAQRASQATDK
jgi:hypothetical protein